MPDVKYEVVVEYQLQGKLQQQMPALQSGVAQFSSALAESRERANGFGLALGSARGSMSDLGRELSAFSSRAADAFTGAVERAGEMAKTLAMVGGAAAFGAAVYGVTHLNSEIEQTKIALADILTSNGVTSNLNEGLGKASGLMAQIRKDAAALPGETTDLAQIFKLASIPALQAGASVDRIEKLSATMMAFGMGVANLDSATVARELNMLLAGRAGSHNILGLQLAGLGGDKAKSFNTLSGSQRMAFLEKEAAKHEGSIGLFGDSFKGLFSSFTDNVVKKRIADATQPLFEHVKGSLRDTMGWFDRNESAVSRFTGRLGDGLAAAWDRGVAAFEEWWPAVQRFATDAYHEIADVWRKVRPDIEYIGTIVRTSLGDGSALKHIEGVLKAYAEVKMARGIAGVVSPFVSAGLGATGGRGGLGALGMGGAFLNPLTGGLAAGAALAGGGIALGVGSALANPSSENHDKAVGAVTDFGRELDHTTKALNTSFMPTLERLGIHGLNSLNELLTGIDDISHPLDYAAFAVQRFGDSLGPMQSGLAAFVESLRGPKLNTSGDVFERPDNDVMVNPGLFIRRMGESIVEAQGKTNQRAKDAAPQTHIDKVEITVSNNHEPSRVAREVVTMIAQMRRHPTVSRDARNWSSITGG